MCHCHTGGTDVSDAITLSEAEISADANQLEVALMFELPIVLVSLNVNDWLEREIYLSGEPLSGCRWNLFIFFPGVESFQLCWTLGGLGLYTLSLEASSYCCAFSAVCADLSLSPPITDSMRLCDPIGAPLSCEKGFHGNQKIMQTLTTVALQQLIAL